MTLSGLIDVPEAEGLCKHGEEYDGCFKICIPSEIFVASGMCRKPGKDDAIWYKDSIIAELHYHNRMLKVMSIGVIDISEPEKGEDTAITSLYDLNDLQIWKDVDLKELKDWNWEEFPQFEFAFKKKIWDDWKMGEDILGTSFDSAITEAVKMLLDDKRWGF